jgi:LPS O-antigen subunit length determinant protein (WzzB/FepE family)
MSPDLFKHPIQVSELRSIHLSLADIGNEMLVKFASRSITVNEFLERLKEMPPLHRPYLGTRNRMIQAVIDMVRDDLLLENALKLKFDKLEGVKESTYKHIEKLLVAEYKKRINSEIFRYNHQNDWEKMFEILEYVKKNTKEKVYEERLFADVSEPDSTMAPPPIQVVIKNDYVW